VEPDSKLRALSFSAPPRASRWHIVAAMLAATGGFFI
jgi:hypothetical protein